MAGFTPDTSCIVAAVCAWHEHHERAAAELNRRFAVREAMVLAAPALVEAFAVLTRLPPPHRLSPSDALALLDTNFISAGKVVALDASAYRRLLRRAPTDGISGGRTYDAVIVACAAKGKASAVVTLNGDHFFALAAGTLEIVVP